MLKRDCLRIIRYKDLLWNLTSRELTVRYKRSLLGFFWFLLNPIIMTACYSIVFATIFKFDTKNYVIYFLSAYLLWNFFAQSTALACGAIVGAGNLIKKVAVPSIVFVLAVILAGLANFVLALLPLVFLVIVLGPGISLAMLFLPVSLGFAILFTIGISLVLAALTVFFSDISEMYYVLLTPFFFMTPVMYRLDIVPPWALPILKLNPMLYIIECFRWPIYYGSLPDLETIAIAAAAACTAAATGYIVFANREAQFVYYV